MDIRLNETLSANVTLRIEDIVTHMYNLDYDV